MEPDQQAIYLNEYALGGRLTEESFSVRSRTLPPVPDGGVLLETRYLSVDPYMRGCMTGLDNYYLPQFDLARPLHSVGIGRVRESRNPEFAEDDLVVGSLEWSPVSVWHPAEGATRRPGGALRRIERSTIAPSHHLGALGTTGITAFFGVLAVACPQPGETFLLSSAAGGVGTVAGQIAKLRGARVYGMTSTAEKRDVLVRKLGFDAALDYRSPDLVDELRDLMPNGPDIYFDKSGAGSGRR
ncbi:hypothetical protein BJF78_06980 [Pseudonocardia sp. CNS-139]|nr:hypothetical protein BJF78_06980 [Pseudonocardia sp. CNS-139]